MLLLFRARKSALCSRSHWLGWQWHFRSSLHYCPTNDKPSIRRLPPPSIMPTDVLKELSKYLFVIQIHHNNYLQLSEWRFYHKKRSRLGFGSCIWLSNFGSYWSVFLPWILWKFQPDNSPLLLQVPRTQWLFSHLKFKALTYLSSSAASLKLWICTQHWTRGQLLGDKMWAFFYFA